MRLAVIADIHANYTALQAVLADIDQQGVDEIINLGDFIDYGPRPEDVTRRLIERNIPSIIGNHEAAVIDPRVQESFAAHAYQSFQITRQMLSEQTVAYIKSLPRVIIKHQLRFVHGVPPDSVHDYIIYQSKHKLYYIFQSLAEPLAFVGHTHVLTLFSWDGEQAVASQLPQGETALEKGYKYIINVGSVGQPREHNKQAKYVIYDSRKQRLDVRFIDYDTARTAAEIRQAGLPEYNARRLF